RYSMYGTPPSLYSKANITAPVQDFASSPDRAVIPGTPTPAPSPEAGAGVMSRRERAHQWATTRAQFRDHQVRMASYETDPALAIDFPAFNDVTVPDVRAMIKALRTATNLAD